MITGLQYSMIVKMAETRPVLRGVLIGGGLGIMHGMDRVLAQKKPRVLSIPLGAIAGGLAGGLLEYYKRDAISKKLKSERKRK